VGGVFGLRESAWMGEREGRRYTILSKWGVVLREVRCIVLMFRGKGPGYFEGGVALGTLKVK